MKTILIFVTTLDGKVTKWGSSDIRSWSSKNDQEHFDSIWAETRVIIMGRGSYDPDPVRPKPNHLFVVLTRTPEKYKDTQVPGQLEFTDKTPLEIVKRLEAEGEEKLLVVGGPNIATLFLKEQLIDELWITFEPKIFGRGGNFVIDENLDISLSLISTEKVNKQGTLINKYRVLKNTLAERRIIHRNLFF